MKISKLLKQTFKKFIDNKPLLMAAALSFYILLATGPILSIFIATIGTVYGEQKIEQKIVSGVQESAGPEVAETVKMVIRKAYKAPSRLMAIISSITLLLFGGTMVFYQTRRALNAIWDIDDDFEGGLLKKLKYYGFSVLMLLIVGSLLILMMLKDPIIYGILNITESIIDIPHASFQIINYIFSFIVLTSAFGAIGSFTLIFIWLFYSSLVFLFGATFTKVYAEKYGSIEMDGN